MAVLITYSALYNYYVSMEYAVFMNAYIYIARFGRFSSLPYSFPSGFFQLNRNHYRNEVSEEEVRPDSTGMDLCQSAEEEERIHIRMNEMKL